MKIRGIEFDDDQNPAAVTVTMTVDEAAQVTKVCGQLSAVTEPPASAATSALYLTMTGYLFNAYWENGVDGCLRGDAE